MPPCCGTCCAPLPPGWPLRGVNTTSTTARSASSRRCPACVGPCTAASTALPSCTHLAEPSARSSTLRSDSSGLHSSGRQRCVGACWPPLPRAPPARQQLPAPACAAAPHLVGQPALDAVPIRPHQQRLLLLWLHGVQHGRRADGGGTSGWRSDAWHELATLPDSCCLQ